MRPSTLLRLAVAGTATDTVRVVLTAVSAALATLAGLAALTVLAIPTPPAVEEGDVRWSEQYASQLLVEPGLRGGTAFASLLLIIPVLALAGQCARLGAPARDRRLAALRLAGATPGQVIRLAAGETGLAALLGTAAGTAIYFGVREVFDTPDERGRLVLPTDVLPASGAFAAVLFGLPVVAALATALILRGVTVSPLGVVRGRQRERGPRPWAGVLIGLGLAAFAAIGPVNRWYATRDTRPPEWLTPALLMAGGLAALVGVVLGTGWISYVTGRLLRRWARRPAVLLAAARLTADPWAGSRTFAALLAAVLFGAGAAGLRSYFEAAAELERRGGGGLAGNGGFYLSTMDLVDLAVAVAMVVASGGLVVALVEGITARRRAYAALVATGVPRATVGRSIAWQALAPAVPAVALALTVGMLLARGLFGTPSSGGYRSEVCDAGEQLCTDPATREQYTRVEVEPLISVTPDVPLGHLAWLGTGAVAAVLVTVAVGLLFLRAGTAVEELRAT
ncbi:FtsX-like permease family protein [Micromonospora endolithica]|uniref:FtsX-like permease family protein n=1 Tax=Micromonospora endolithica TaxID=230091 RepID=A0A3A9ZJC7_9ACTN|nr:FtsX-like permease family protein [Micromonospora endolithica]RKN48329.1 FtsX-like permease family protein [Micromonospora endolithica]TWJ24610.1 FtsX-like permease family protein [Micromonospora endolithica]